MPVSICQDATAVLERVDRVSAHIPIFTSLAQCRNGELRPLSAPPDDGSDRVDSAMGLSEALTGSGGKTHSIGQCRNYFADAGLGELSNTEFTPNILHRISALKAPDRWGYGADSQKRWPINAILSFIKVGNIDLTATGKPCSIVSRLRRWFVAF